MGGIISLGKIRSTFVDALIVLARTRPVDGLPIFIIKHRLEMHFGGVVEIVDCGVTLPKHARPLLCTRAFVRGVKF